MQHSTVPFATLFCCKRKNLLLKTLLDLGEALIHLNKSAMCDTEIAKALKALYNGYYSEYEVYQKQGSLKEWMCLLKKRKYKRKFVIDERDVDELTSFSFSHYGI